MRVWIGAACSQIAPQIGTHISQWELARGLLSSNSSLRGIFGLPNRGTLGDLIASFTICCQSNYDLEGVGNKFCQLGCKPSGIMR